MSAEFAPRLLGGLAFDVVDCWCAGVLVRSPGETTVSSNRKGMTFFQMLRDVLVASLNRGQFPMAIMGLIVTIAVCRMPPADLSRLIFRLLNAAEAHQYGGYVLSLVIALAWAIHGKGQRRVMTAEIRRLSEQRNRFHQLALDGHIKSSRRRK